MRPSSGSTSRARSDLPNCPRTYDLIFKVICETYQVKRACSSSLLPHLPEASVRLRVSPALPPGPPLSCLPAQPCARSFLTFLVPRCHFFHPPPFHFCITLIHLPPPSHPSHPYIHSIYPAAASPLYRIPTRRNTRQPPVLPGRASAGFRPQHDTARPERLRLSRVSDLEPPPSGPPVLQ